MRRSCNKCTHAKNLHVGVTNVKITRRHSNTFRRRPLHGFTLVELLVVLSIIALLVSILIVLCHLENGRNIFNNSQLRHNNANGLETIKLKQIHR